MPKDLILHVNLILVPFGLTFFSEETKTKIVIILHLNRGIDSRQGKQVNGHSYFTHMKIMSQSWLVHIGTGQYE